MGWFTGKKKEEEKVEEEKLEEAALHEGNGQLFEGLNIEEDAVYRKVKARHEQRSASTVNTLLAIKSHRKRRKIVSHRIRRLKCLITFLFCIAFILSSPYWYILYQIRANSVKEKIPLGVGFIYQHVNGTTQLEIGISCVLLAVSILRVVFPKKETIYYISHISYLFVIIHYGILIPLNGRNFWKNLANLEDNMGEELQEGRCIKVPVMMAVKSKFKTIGKIKDSKGCIAETMDIGLNNLRFDVQKECDGDKTWFHTAIRLALEVNNSVITTVEAEEKLKNREWIKANGTYEVYSQKWTNSQRRNKCCGINNPDDWFRYTKKVEYQEKHFQELLHKFFIYPDSCCPPMDQNTIQACVMTRVHGGTCTSHEQLTVISYSLSTLMTLIACGVFNLTIFILLIRLRRMVERFRPDLLQLS